MSKYNSGDKFVIEVDTAFGLMGGNPLYTIKGFNALVFDDNGLDRLPQFPNGEDSNDLYMLTQEEKAVVEDKAYNKGLNDAWELARKMNSELTATDLELIFGIGNASASVIYSKVLKNLTPQEALAKMEAYEKSHIEVGDVVVMRGIEVIVTYIHTNNTADVLLDNGYTGKYEPINQLKKTGRHIDIGRILEEIRG